MNKHNEEIPEWIEIIELWTFLNVPEIDFIKFEIAKHHQNSPWSCKQAKFCANSNPQKETAYHLCVYLKNKSDELKTAYKINAFCTQLGLDDFRAYALRPLFLKYELSQGCWNANAKYVLPSFNYAYVNLYGKPLGIFSDWVNIVTYAANEWKDIAEKWALVIIPDFMDKASKEYNEWCKHFHKIHQEEEREEYERLKRKFEKH
ncbi:MAG: hypothetical protein V1484_00600 [bacterium]